VMLAASVKTNDVRPWQFKLRALSRWLHACMHAWLVVLRHVGYLLLLYRLYTWLYMVLWHKSKSVQYTSYTSVDVIARDSGIQRVSGWILHIWLIRTACCDSMTMHACSFAMSLGMAVGRVLVVFPTFGTART
jgi:hypothetical protein